MAAASPGSTPVDVAIDRDDAVTLTWPDGHLTRLSLGLLRDRCPCAACARGRRVGDVAAPGAVDDLRVAGAELVGAWGLGLAWSDGHATGVYRWDVLRSWCRCAACASPP